MEETLHIIGKSGSTSLIFFKAIFIFSAAGSINEQWNGALTDSGMIFLIPLSFAS